MEQYRACFISVKCTELLLAKIESIPTSLVFNDFKQTLYMYHDIVSKCSVLDLEETKLRTPVKLCSPQISMQPIHFK